MVVVDPDADQDDGGGVVGSAESDELDARIQENFHHHPTSRWKRRNVAQEMSLLYWIIYGRWSGGTPQVWMTGR